MRDQVIREIGTLAGVSIGAGAVLGLVESSSLFLGAIFGAIMFGMAMAAAYTVVRMTR
jgi:hypothetical protein